MTRYLLVICLLIGVLLPEPSASQGRTKTRRATDPRPQAAEQVQPQTTEPGEPLPEFRRGLDAPINPDEYIIGPYDEFILFIEGQEPVQKRVFVLPEGTVLLPNAGVFHAAGKTITEFRDELQAILDRYYRNVRIHVQLVVPRRFTVYVLGEVGNPGMVELFAPYRLETAVEAAGGVTENGSTRAIEVRKGDELVRTVDLERFRRLADSDENPALYEGISVYVPTRRASCSIVGEVWRTGDYELRPGDTVEDIVALAGGFRSNADMTRMLVERFDENNVLSVLDISETELATARLQDQDAIIIPDRRTFQPQEFVRVLGGGGRGGRIYLQENETLATMVPRVARLRDDYDLARGVIERTGPDGVTLFINVDFGEVMKGAAIDTLRLFHGDVISVPIVEDVVYVTGEVVAPGEVDFQRGLPAGKYLALAGGPTQAGSIDKLEIYDTQGHRRDGDRDSLVYRGETILVKRRNSVIFGNVFFGVVSLTSLVIALVAVTR